MIPFFVLLFLFDSSKLLPHSRTEQFYFFMYIHTLHFVASFIWCYECSFEWYIKCICFRLLLQRKYLLAMKEIEWDQKREKTNKIEKSFAFFTTVVFLSPLLLPIAIITRREVTRFAGVKWKGNRNEWMNKK